MSVRISQAFRNSFATTVPVLTPLYNADCDSWQFAAEGEFHCGNTDKCQLPLRLDGVETQHCSLLFRFGQLRIRRIDGRVWVNDLPVAQEYDVSPGDIISIGPVSFEVGESPRIPQLTQSVSEAPAHKIHPAFIAVPSVSQPRSGAAPSADLPTHQDVDVAAERAALASERMRVVELREQQYSALMQGIQDRERILTERERALADRQRTIDDRGVLLHEQQTAIGKLQNSLASVEQNLLQQRDDAQRRLEGLLEKELFLRRQKEASDAAVTDLEQRAAAIRKREAELKEYDERTDRLRLEVETQRVTLTQQKQSLNAQSLLLSQRSEELDAWAAELAQQKQTVEVPATQGGRETRSVEQLAAIAAEREALLKTRHEVFRAKAEANAAQTALINERSRLGVWQAELDSRSAELADRVSALKSLWKETRANRIQQSQQTSDLMTEWAALKERQNEVVAAETRLRELQESARLMHDGAAAEREALQNTHQDLLCERNSLVQLSQDLHTREAQLHERERMVDKQTEDLKSKYEAFAVQAAALQKEEAELNSRAADIDQQILQLKSEIGEQESRRMLSADADGNSAVRETTAALTEQLHQLSMSLCETEEQRNTAVQERDQMLVAVRELQRALKDAQKDLQEAALLKLEFADHEQTLAKLYETIEERSVQLQRNDCLWRQSLEEIESLKGQLAQMTLERDELSSRRTDIDPMTPPDDGDETELQLISQIESLRSSIQQATAAESDLQAEFRTAVSEREQSIRDLELEVESLRAQLQEREKESSCHDAVDMADVDRLRDRLEKANEVLQDRDDLIRELRSRLAQKSQQTMTRTIDAEVLQNDARELDRRAGLLDQREEELSERSRQVDHSEEEIESQRRQLLDARQQLELARAEIQVAMKQHAVAAVQPSFAEPVLKATSAGAKLETSSARTDSESASRPPGSAADSRLTQDSETPQDLQFELAGLFGIRKPPIQPTPRPEMPALDFIDLSEPAGESTAVAFRFGDDADSVIRMAADESAAETPTEAPRAENSDDFVRDYMEQLLARSRKSAGNVLPSELKPAKSEEKSEAKSQPSQPSEPVQSRPQTPKVRSFIDQYMAGDFGDLTGDGSIAVQPEKTLPTEPVSAIVASTENRLPRGKIDLQKMRENMDSLRTLSTQSVEHALVNHARRQERHSISGRITSAAVLVAMSLFVAVANIRGVIDYPFLTWVALAVAICACAELARKLVTLRAHGIAVPLAEDLHEIQDTLFTAPPADTESSADPLPVDTQIGTGLLQPSDSQQLRSDPADPV